jgi:hypothetical protein
MNRLSLTAALLCLCCLSSLKAEDIFALTASNRLLRFDSASPANLISAVQITGLQASETLVGIDFRPLTGQLYGVGSTSRLYTINVSTGAATTISAAPFNPVLAGLRFGVDFNPVADRLRVVGNGGQNLRLNPNDGTVAGTDTTLAYAQLDPAVGIPPHLESLAYSNNTELAASTTLFGIDTNLNTLMTVGSTNGTVSPNTGLCFTVGALSSPPSVSTGFDISGQTGVAYASLTAAGDVASKLYTINLSTGTATLTGTIAGGEVILDISAASAPTPFDIVALKSNNTLIRFNSSTPTVVSNGIPVTGMQAGESLQEIDFRPSNGLLYGIGSTSRIYTVDPITGAATVVSAAPLNPLPTSFNMGFDFNPVVDRIRIVNDKKENFRVNPDNGATASVDTPLSYAPGDVNAGAVTISVVAAAYTNNVAGATATTLYGIDAQQNVLVTINPPNSGVLSTVGAINVNINSNLVGFDITPGGLAFAAINNNFYTINLANGAATQVGNGNIGGGNTVRSIAAVVQTQQPVLQLSAAAYFVIETNVAAITVTRTGNSSGVVSVDYAVTSGTAVAGTNFTAVSGTLTFLNGETQRTIFVPTLNDKKLDPFLTAAVTLSNPVGAKLGAQTAAVLTIADLNDIDGDGFPNEIEVAAGSDPNNAASTPFGTLPAGALQPLTMKTATVKLNFAKPTLSDSIGVSGTFANTLATIPAGAKFIIEAGDVNGKAGVIQVFTFDANGKPAPKGLTLSKPRNGVSSFSVTLTKGTFAALLAAAGLTNANASKVPVTLNVNVYFNNVSYAAAVPTLYTATMGKSGSTTIVKKK